MKRKQPALYPPLSRIRTESATKRTPTWRRNKARGGTMRLTPTGSFRGLAHRVLLHFFCVYPPYAKTRNHDEAPLSWRQRRRMPTEGHTRAQQQVVCCLVRYATLRRSTMRCAGDLSSLRHSLQHGRVWGVNPRAIERVCSDRVVWRTHRDLGFDPLQELSLPRP